MAESLTHKWGQTIGNLLQRSLRETFQEVADRHGLYLDYQRERSARAGTAKVSWKDRYGNSHDLDYVLERGGTDAVVGLPAAFIEVAWRRYTKHSKNKAQEIEGAVIALADTYSHVRPFLGIVLAGVFTDRAVAQLRSRQFTVAFIPYAHILHAFTAVGIDAAWDEDTPETSFREKLAQFQALSVKKVAKLTKALLLPAPAKLTEGETPPAPMAEFLEALNASLSRGILGFTITVLHGQPRQVAAVAEAIAYLQGYEDARPSAAPAAKYEIDVRYNNGDLIHAIFQDKGAAVNFLQTFA